MGELAGEESKRRMPTYSLRSQARTCRRCRLSFPFISPERFEPGICISRSFRSPNIPMSILPCRVAFSSQTTASSAKHVRIDFTSCALLASM